MENIERKARRLSGEAEFDREARRRDNPDYDAIKAALSVATQHLIEHFKNNTQPPVDKKLLRAMTRVADAAKEDKSIIQRIEQMTTN